MGRAEAAAGGRPVGHGRGVHPRHFGAWVDLGVGFPGLLEIIYVAGLTPERYRAGDWCPVGTEVTAFVGGFRDDGRQVYLWQVRPAGEQRNAEPGAAADPPRAAGR